MAKTFVPVRQAWATRRWRIRFLCLLAVVILVGGGSIFWHKTMYHFKTVAPGKLYRSGTLSTVGLEIAHALYGIKTIVNLRTGTEMQEEWYDRERKFAEAKRIYLVDIPMLPDTPPTAAQIATFLSVATDAGMLPILVHCEMGIVRTGMMVAVYRTSILREPNAKVLAELPMFGRTLKRRPEVEAFILNYRPPGQAAPAPARTGAGADQPVAQ